MFIVIEGIDGTGKNTLAEKIREMYPNPEQVIITEEPYLQETRKLVPVIKDPIGVALLFSADRRYHIKNVILPSLHEGKHVISVRYALSTLVYESCLGASTEELEKINEITTKEIVPDIGIILDIDVYTALERIKKRGEIDNFFEKKVFLEEVRRKYLYFAEKYGYQVFHTYTIDDTVSIAETIVEQMIKGEKSLQR